MPNAEPGHPGRPRVICHMMASVDGRIVTDDWPLSDTERAEYERVHQSYEADGWLVGRVTLERHFAAGTRSDAEVAREYHGPPRADFVAPGAAGEQASFAFAVDARGKLVWESRDVDGGGGARDAPCGTRGVPTPRARTRGHRRRGARVRRRLAPQSRQRPCGVLAHLRVVVERAREHVDVIRRADVA
jgi:hypothetical protein